MPELTLIWQKKNKHDDAGKSGADSTTSDKGVRFPAPEAVEIGEDVDPDRISGDKGVIIHAGCRIYGQSTLILDGHPARIRGPGHGRRLSDRSQCRAWTAVTSRMRYFWTGLRRFRRAGARRNDPRGRGQHCPHGRVETDDPVSVCHLGSLINFCDCLMAGGTGQKKSQRGR